MEFREIEDKDLEQLLENGRSPVYKTTFTTEDLTAYYTEFFKKMYEGVRDGKLSVETMTVDFFNDKWSVEFKASNQAI